MTRSCSTTTSPYTTTTAPPWVPPIGSDGCLRVFYECDCGDPPGSAFPAVWSPVFRDCVSNRLCSGTLLCDTLSYYHEYIDYCVVGDPVPAGPDEPAGADAPCLPDCCPGGQCAKQDWVCYCTEDDKSNLSWQAVAAPICVPNSSCGRGSYGTDLDYHMEEIDGCIGDVPLPGSPGPPPIAVGDCCPTTTPPPPVTTTPPPYDPGCQADWSAACALGSWVVSLVGTQCVNGCTAESWTNTGTCTETARTCVTDTVCTPGFRCGVTPNPALVTTPPSVPPCCSTTTPPPPPTPVCRADWKVECVGGTWEAPQIEGAPACMLSSDCTATTWYEAPAGVWHAVSCNDDTCRPTGLCVAVGDPPTGAPAGSCGNKCEANYGASCYSGQWFVTLIDSMCVPYCSTTGVWEVTGGDCLQTLKMCGDGGDCVPFGICSVIPDPDPPEPPTIPSCCTLACEAEWVSFCSGDGLSWTTPVLAAGTLCSLMADCGTRAYGWIGDSTEQHMVNCTENGCTVLGVGCDTDPPAPAEPTTPLPCDPPAANQCQALYQANCSNGVWSVSAMGGQCSPTCYASSWTPVGPNECQQEAYTCTDDPTCEPYSACNVTPDPPSPSEPTSIPVCCTPSTWCVGDWLVTCQAGTGMWGPPELAAANCGDSCETMGWTDFGSGWQARTCSEQACVLYSTDCIASSDYPSDYPTGSCLPQGTVCVSDWIATCVGNTWEINPDPVTECSDTCSASLAWSESSPGNAQLRTCYVNACGNMGDPCMASGIPAPPDDPGWESQLYCP